MNDTMVNVVIPTVEGREEYLARCIRGYKERTPNVSLNFIVVKGAATCGLAWEMGASKMVEGYLHLTADDIVPGEGWLPPLIASVEGALVPVALVITASPEVLDEEQMPLPGNPLTPVSNFLERQGGPDVIPDGYICQGMSEYPSVPFCTQAQWLAIKPMVASHYGTDKWFGYRAKLAGFHNVVTHGSCFYHYAAHAGRIPRDSEGWMHLDRLNFDLNVAFDCYVNGTLPPKQLHHAHGTPEGRQMAREWYKTHVPGPGYWEGPEVEEQYR